ncbi:ventral homeobox [Nelusetta ayraudi]|uniref:ventral homeobox n=1 Tax=Nelusetta ayraudi TaxID=303726 RepID=UPI003F71AB71
MVRYFSVDWLAQSHHSTSKAAEQEAASPLSCRPHVPCMVQPRPPAYGECYLQPKPKASRPVHHTESERPTTCASPVSDTSGYSSGYESEAASSDCLSVDESGCEAETDGLQRRVRTKFTPEQINRLEKIFSKHKYLEAGERVKTAQKLNLTETQVRTWFQNRRMKLKRDLQDYFAPQATPLMFQPPAVHYHRDIGPLRPHYPAPASAFYALPVQQMVFQQPSQHIMRNQHFH